MTHSDKPRKGKDHTGLLVNDWLVTDRRRVVVGHQVRTEYTLVCQLCGNTKRWIGGHYRELEKDCSKCKTKVSQVNPGDIHQGWKAVEPGATYSKWECMGCGEVHERFTHNIISAEQECCRKCSLKWEGLSTGKSGKCIRPYQIWANAKQRGVMGGAWYDDFPAFLKFYLDKLGQDLEYFQRHKVPWSHHQIIREDDSKPYSPTNLMVVPFFSERCYHKLTVKYWRKLKLADLLSPELRDSYALFVLTFGLKEPYARLKRKRLTEPHSASNSEWILRH